MRVRACITVISPEVFQPWRIPAIIGPNSPNLKNQRIAATDEFLASFCYLTTMAALVTRNIEK